MRKKGNAVTEKMAGGQQQKRKIEHMTNFPIDRKNRTMYAEDTQIAA
jgi:hypothetical protein